MIRDEFDVLREFLLLLRGKGSIQELVGDTLECLFKDSAGVLVKQFLDVVRDF